MEPFHILCLAIVGALVFGYSMALLAFMVIAKSIDSSPVNFRKSVTIVIGFFVCNGTVVFAGGASANRTVSLSDIPHGTTVWLIAYLLGFGTSITVEYYRRPRPISFRDNLARVLTGRQLSVIWMIYECGVTNYDDAAKLLGMSREQFDTHHTQAIACLGKEARNR